MAEAGTREDKDRAYAMVLAIDFGTRFSGYAFSLKGKEHDIRINNNWADNTGSYSYQAPTAVLLNSDGSFNSFGFEAEERYADIDDDSDNDEDDGKDEKHGRDVRTVSKGELFRNFKMTLHTQKNLNERTVVVSESGYIFPALEIFAHAISYLKDHLMKALGKELAKTPDPDTVKWVLTVPAIWSEEAKEFMKMAAYKAGCIADPNSTQLVIALEPEAASFFCRQLDLNPFERKDDFIFHKGTKYLVVDCGGGTNDMVAHEVMNENCVKEIHSVHGGSHGGNSVNENFRKVLEKILGCNFINHFQQKYPKEWFLLMSRFEFAKKKVSEENTRICIEVTHSMPTMYCELNNGKEFATAFMAFKADGITYRSGSIILQRQAVVELFHDVVNSIVDNANDMVTNSELNKLKYIIMVGGFSECHYLKVAMKEKFERLSCKVLVPRDAQLAVVKGAVLFGHHKNRIVSRKARKVESTSLDVAAIVLGVVITLTARFVFSK